MIAILPAAGKGTRMAAITAGRSKEMIEVGGRKLIDIVLEEASQAGASQSIVVLSRGKKDLLEHLKDFSTVVFQEMPRGHGDAVATPAVEEAALVLNPDTIFYPSSPARRLVKAILGGADIALAVEQVNEAEIQKYGIVEMDHDARIQRIWEKPEFGETSSRWAIAGRFALSFTAFAFVRRRVQESRDDAGEIQLTPILSEAISAGQRGIAIPTLPGEVRLDCGSEDGYRRALELVR